MELSIVIPTYNRSNLLRRTLSSLLPQVREFPEAEVIVIDDGSSDDTSVMLTRLTMNGDLPIHIIHQNHLGPAAARNRGLHTAKGEWILFLGDDIFTQPKLLERHIYAHRHICLGADTAVVGLVVWDPKLVISPFMRWWGNHHLIFP